MTSPALELFNLVCNGPPAVVIDYLSSSSIHVDVQNDKGDTPLIMAARRGSLEVVLALLSKGASVTCRNLKGSSPLIAAAMKGHTKICQLFIEKGANINQTTDSCDTALSLSIWQNHTDVCLLLIDNGAKTDNVDKFGDTMLLDAAKHGNYKIMKRLLQNDFNKNINQNDINIHTNTSLSNATSSITSSLTSHRLVNHANKKGDTPLIRASWKGDSECVELLLQNDASIIPCNSSNQNALVMSSMHNNRKSTIVLCNYLMQIYQNSIKSSTSSSERNRIDDEIKTIIDCIDDSNQSALSYLTSYTQAPVQLNSSQQSIDESEPHWDAINILLRLSCNVTKPLNTGNVLLCRAANCNSKQTVKLLLKRQKNSKDHVDKIKIKFQNYITQIHENENKQSIIQENHETKDEDQKQEILPEINDTNDKISTSTSSTHQTFDRYQFHVTYGEINLNYADPSNKSRHALLAHLQSCSDESMIDLLVSCGCSVDQIDIDGSTALMLAVKQSLVKIVKLLLFQYSATLLIENNKGQNALTLAMNEVRTLKQQEILYNNNNNNSSSALTPSSQEIKIKKQLDSAMSVMSILNEYTARELGCNALMLHAAKHGDIDKLAALLITQSNESSNHQTPQNSNRNFEKNSNQSKSPKSNESNESQIETITKPSNESESSNKSAPSVTIHTSNSPAHSETSQTAIDQSFPSTPLQQCDIHSVNHLGQTALMLAAQNGHLSCVTLLLAHGAQPLMRDKFGNTALELSLQAEQPWIIQPSSTTQLTNITQTNIKKSDHHKCSLLLLEHQEKQTIERHVYSQQQVMAEGGELDSVTKFLLRLASQLTQQQEKLNNSINNSLIQSSSNNTTINQEDASHINSRQ